MKGWPSNRIEVTKDIQPYQTLIYQMEKIDEMAMKGQRIIIPIKLQQLHSNHMVIENT